MKVRKTGIEIVDQMAMDDINSAVTAIDEAKDAEQRLKAGIRVLYCDYVESSGRDIETLEDVRTCSDDLYEVVVARKNLAKEVYRAVGAFEYIERYTRQSISKSNETESESADSSGMNKLFGKSYVLSRKVVKKLKGLSGKEVELNEAKKTLVQLKSNTSDDEEIVAIERELAGIEIQLRVLNNQKISIEQTNKSMNKSFLKISSSCFFLCMLIFSTYLFM